MEKVKLDQPDMVHVNKKGKKKRRAPEEDSANGLKNEAFTEGNPSEPTMEEKLERLNILSDDNKKDKTKKRETPYIKPPAADSVHVLLKQALHADDRSLLLECLYTRDEKVITKSISLLTPADVLILLKFFVYFVQLRGAVLVCVLPWVRSLLSQHASSIASQESSLALLNSLYQLIDSRISTFDSVLQLSTCLDFHFSAIPDDESDQETALPLVYEDKDTDDDEADETMETDDSDNDLGDVIDAPESSEDGIDDAMSD